MARCEVCWGKATHHVDQVVLCKKHATETEKARKIVLANGGLWNTLEYVAHGRPPVKFNLRCREWVLSAARSKAKNHGLSTNEYLCALIVTGMNENNPTGERA